MAHVTTANVDAIARPTKNEGVNRIVQLLAPDGWKTERQSRIVDHGGCGQLDEVDRVDFRNRILRHINRLGYIRQTITHPFVNKTG
jgi:hypothetical protein